MVLDLDDVWYIFVENMIQRYKYNNPKSCNKLNDLGNYKQRNTEKQYGNSLRTLEWEIKLFLWLSLKMLIC